MTPKPTHPKNPVKDLAPTESDTDTDTNSPNKSNQAQGQGKGKARATKPGKHTGPGEKDAHKGGEETLREKAMKQLNGGSDSNPTQLGDPTSLKSETSEKAPKPEEEGAKTGGKRRDSKL